MSLHRSFFSAIILLFCVGASYAQSAETLTVPPNAVPDATDGKDQAGRPVGDVKAPEVQPLAASEGQQFQQNVKDIHFDFDRAELRAEDHAILASDAEWLKAHPDVIIVLHGDADERGDIVYNLVLSDRRAIATRDALVQLGVPSDRILFTEGWGKLYPVCNTSDESCWSQNRRTHIEAWQNLMQPQPEQVASR
jgi:peptidoglycan-associated lipoprotein